LWDDPAAKRKGFAPGQAREIAADNVSEPMSGAPSNGNKALVL